MEETAACKPMICVFGNQLVLYLSGNLVNMTVVTRLIQSTSFDIHRHPNQRGMGSRVNENT